jgi:hypothetical protein
MRRLRIENCAAV